MDASSPDSGAGSRAAQKRARKLQKKQQAALKPAPAGPSRPAPPLPPAADDAHVGNKREKRKAKRLAKRQELEADPDGADEPEELEGVVVDGELLLRDGASGAVYSSERDERGRLVQVGRWESGTVVPLAPADEACGAPAAAPAAPPPSVPHPVPKPLAFDAAEDDHCETAPEAYTHIAELLRRLAAALGYADPAELRIYDPYFCNGAVARHLGALGFPRVHNVNEDFYAVVASGRVPDHDVVVTNPPYSGTHPSRLLAFLAANRRPWLSLMPNWVHAKEYFGPATAAPGHAPFYVVPRKRYHYWTPRGRRADVASGGAKAKSHGHTNAALGARTSPFVSFWYGAAFPPALRAQLPRPDGCVVCLRAEALPPSVLADSDPQRWGGGGGGGGGGAAGGGGNSEQRKKKQRSQ